MARITSRFGIRRKQGALLRLRGTLTWRRFTKQTGRFVGLLLALLIFLPMTLSMGFGTWFGYTHSPDGWPFVILGFMLVGMWGGWILFPLIAASVSDSIDLDNLMIYPITRRDIVISNIFGTLFDYQTYLLLPLFLPIVVAFGGFGRFAAPNTSLAMLPLALAVCIIGYFLMTVSSQLVLTALGGVLQSRRTRDVAIVLMSLLGFGCWAASQAFVRVADFMTETIEAGSIEAFDPLRVMQWLPTGALARSVEQAAQGAWGISLLWVGYALLWLLVLGWLWGLLLERLLTGQGFLLGDGAGGEQVTKAKSWGLGWMRGWVSAETRFIAAKELKSIWRIPQRRIGLLQAFLMPLVFVAIPFLQGNSDLYGSIEVGASARWLIPSYTLILMWFLGQNMLGWEHSGLSMLLTMPVARRHIFLGKSIALLLIGLPPLAIIGLVLAVLSDDLNMIFWTILGLFTALPAMAVAAVTSALFPYPVQLDFKTNRSSFTRGGCLAAIVILIPVPLAFVLLNLPLYTPLLVAQFVPQFRWAGLIVGILGLPWAVFVFFSGMRIAGNQLSKREPEAISAARPTKND